MPQPSSKKKIQRRLRRRRSEWHEFHLSAREGGGDKQLTFLRGSDSDVWRETEPDAHWIHEDGEDEDTL